MAVAAQRRDQVPAVAPRQLALDLVPSHSVADGTYPGFQTHSETSREAAAHVHRTGSAASQRGRVLAQLGRGPATIHELAAMLDVVDGTASARVRELTLAGEIERTAFHRLNPSGVRAVLWRLVGSKPINYCRNDIMPLAHGADTRESADSAMVCRVSVPSGCTLPPPEPRP
jgi:hypothetical protein